MPAKPLPTKLVPVNAGSGKQASRFSEHPSGSAYSEIPAYAGMTKRRNPMLLGDVIIHKEKSKSAADDNIRSEHAVASWVSAEA